MGSVTSDRRQGLNSGVAIKAPCRAATTANITLNGEQTIDGVAVVTGNRVLVKNQTSGVNNGIYVVDTGAWTRDLDFDGSYDVVSGTMVVVLLGTTNNGSVWYISTTGAITIGTTSLTFTQLPSLAGTSAFIVTLLNDADAATARATLGAAAIAGDNFTGPVSSTAGEFNLKTITALADAAATLTGAQLKSGLFTITPTVARTLTLDTAANILAAIPGHVDGSHFEFSVVNNAAFNITLAAGVGVTLDGRTVINNGSATWRIVRTSATTVRVFRVEGFTAVNQMMYVRDEKAVGTTGGNSLAGVNTRVVNTVVYNTIVGASLSANQLTLPGPGTFRIRGRAPSYTVNGNKLYLYNISTAALSLAGSSSRTATTIAIVSDSNVNGVVTIASPTIFELRHFIEIGAVDGLGPQSNAAAAGVEVYAELWIEKEGV